MKSALFAVLFALIPAAQAAPKTDEAPKADAKTEAAKPEEAKTEAAKPEEAKTEAAKTEEAKPEDKAAAKPAEGKKGQADAWSEDQKTLYTLGAMFGSQVTALGLKEGEVKFVTQGLRDTAMGKEPAVDPMAYRAKIGELGRARLAAKAEVRKKKDKAFLDKAAKEKGAKALPSGLVYTEVKAGKGDSPTATDTVKASYEGRLTDGTVFDASEKHGGPLEFSLAGVVRCWTEGIQKMKVGGKAKLVCPSEIAYGDMGRPPVIPGGAALIFDVELVAIVKK